MDITKGLERIAATIESQPVCGHWPPLMADKDAALVRRALAEIERLEGEVSDAAGRLISANSHIDKLIREREECRAKLDAYTDRMIAAGLMA